MTSGASRQHDSTAAVDGLHAVLLIDADDAARVAIARRFTDAEIAVGQAATGRRGLALAQSGDYDAILLDAAVPDLQLDEMLRRLQQDPAAAGVPVILLANHVDRRTQQRAMRYGAAGVVLRRDASPATLLARLGQAPPPTSTPYATAPTSASLDAPAAPATPATSSSPAAPAAAPAMPPTHQPTSPATPAPRPPRATPIQPASLRDKIDAARRHNTAGLEELFNGELLPVASATRRDALVAQLRDGRSEARQLVPALLEEPAMLLAFYAQAQQQGIDDASGDPFLIAMLIDQAGPAETIWRLPAAHATVASEVQPWYVRTVRHSVIVAALCHALARAANVEPGPAAAAGLLHELGRLSLLASALGGAALQTYDVARNTVLPTAFAEESLLGLTAKQVTIHRATEHGIAPRIARASLSYDLTDAQRNRLDEEDRRLAGLVIACDQYARATGLVGCPSAELTPPPAPWSQHFRARHDQLMQLVEQLRQRFDAALEGAAPPSLTDGRPLQGVSIAVACADPTTWRPATAVYAAAGASCHAIALEAPADARGADLLVVDLLGTPLREVLPSLRAMGEATGLPPRLVLAERSDEPESSLRDTDADARLYLTPVRPGNLIQAARRLSGRRGSEVGV